MHKGIKKERKHANIFACLRVCVLLEGLLRREFLVLKDSTLFIYL